MAVSMGRVSASPSDVGSAAREDVKCSAIRTRSVVAPSGRVGASNPVRNHGSNPQCSTPKCRCKAYASVANQDFPALPGPMNTVNGRSSTHARTIGPKSVTSIVNGRSAVNG